jgi:hypothetical protein
LLRNLACTARLLKNLGKSEISVDRRFRQASFGRDVIDARVIGVCAALETSTEAYGED